MRFSGRFYGWTFGFSWFWLRREWKEGLLKWMKRCGLNTWPMSDRIHGNDHSIKQQNLRCYSAKENCRSRCSLEVVILSYCLLKFNYKYKRILTYRPWNIRFAREKVKQQLIWGKDIFT